MQNSLFANRFMESPTFEKEGFVKMNLKFPPLSGGVNQGLNDAGIETFEGDYAHYVVRECTQNSLDAAASHAARVRLEITLREIATSDLPFISELRDVLDRCEIYWRPHPRPREFFRKASRYAIGDNLYLLKISDFGTTGVPGSDEDNTKPWFGLVRSRGVSIKAEEDSGGAFGIGKDAPLAASALRTVLYSSRTTNGEVAFQGICRLATHQGESDLTQATGFIGDYDEAAKIFRAIRDPEEIPEQFRRNEAGLDVWVVGFRNINHEWEVPFVAAALRNFWPAIHFQRLTLRIGGYKINHHTLPDLMNSLRGEEAVAEAFPFYQSVTAPGVHTVEDDLQIVGKCRLHVFIGGRELPRKICMTRKTGMVIYLFPPRDIRVPFSGLFCCDDTRGNLLLKTLEPPSHDDWSLKRAETDQQRNALKEIKSWIRQSLKRMIPDIDRDLINEDTIANLLPDDLPGPTNAEGDDTDLGGKPVAPDKLKRIDPLVPMIRVKAEGDKSRGTDDTKSGGGKGDTTDPKKGDGKPTGGRTDLAGGETPPGGGAAAPRVRIDLRSYRGQECNGSYYLIARSESDHAGDLRIDAVTEDGGSVSCPLAAAFDAAGNPLVVADNRITGLTLAANQPVRLRVVLQHPARVALRASTL
jgi:hypothetical protein